MLSSHRTRQFFFVILLLLITRPIQALERGPQGTIRAGVFPVAPLIFVDEQGGVQGLFPDLLREIVRDEGWAVTFVPGSWEEGLDRLQKGEIDLILSVAFSPERAEIMDFNYEPVVELWGQVFVNPDGKSKNINDLDGRKVAVMRKDITGSNFIMTTEKLGLHCEIVEFSTHAEVFTAVQKGVADAGVSPQHIGLRHAKEYNLVGSSIIFSPFSVFFASKKGMQHELLSHIDAHISNWKKDSDSLYYNRLNYWIGGQNLAAKIPVWLIYTTIIFAFAILLFAGFTVLLKRTVRVRTEELRESEVTFRKLFEDSFDAILLIDNTGAFVECNQSALDLLMMTREQFLLLSPARISPEFQPDGRRSAMAAREIIALAYSKGLLRFDWTHVNSEGGEFIVEVSLLPVTIKGQAMLHTTWRDITKRKQSEEALRESEAKFRAMVETFPLAIHQTVGVEQITEYVNPTMVKLFGYTQADIPSVAQWWPLAYPDEIYRVKIAEEWTKRVKQAIATQSPIEPMEVVCTCKDGSKKNISWGYITLGDKNYSCGLDITDRKQAEEALRKSEELLSRAQEIAHTGSWKLDLTANHLTWSDEVYRIFGYEPQEFAATYEAFLDAVHPDDRALVDEVYSRSLRDGSDSYELEHRIAQRNSGEVRYVLERCVHERDDAGTIIQSTGMVQDITKRKQADEKLRLSEECFKALAEACFGGIIIHDKGLILECNQGLSDITGFSYEEHIGMNGLELIAPESMDTVLANIWSGYDQGYEVTGVRKDGSKYPLAIRGKNITYKGLEARVIEFRDITDRKQAEVEREKLQAQLTQAQKMESVGRLAGGVAHDFNNMLGVILGRVELVLEDLEEESRLHDDLKVIQTAAERSAALTRQLLTFARKQIIVPRQLDLNDTVERMLSMLRRLIGEDIDLIWKPVVPLGPIKMDPSQIDQILANLCVNARDAIAGVGSLTIETGRQTFDEAYCRDHPGFIPGDFVLLAVSDNGCGMDKKTLDNLFEPFFTTKGVGQGTGLGLATVYGIVKQNNGFINIYSEPDLGSTFKIYLPRQAADDETAIGIPARETSPGGDETILLVEDEPMILDMTTIMLERLGYTVLAAPGPGEAIRLAGEHTGQIDLLMTDVVMPEMNGRDLAGKITALYPGIRLFFMSGYTANVIAHQGVLDAGVEFIQKPFSKADVAVKLRGVLED